ncbi:MAG: sialidase family protein [Chloroflexia bacterium]
MTERRVQRAGGVWMATWGANVNVSNGLDNNIGLDAPKIAVYPSGEIYIVWFNPYPGYDGCQVSGYFYETCLYMAASANGGTGFSRWTLWGSNDDSYYIIYGDRTTDHGQSWGTDFAISPAGVNARSPRLALAPDGKLYAAYATDAGLVYVRRSSDGGQTWSTPVAASSIYGGGELGAFDLAVDNNGTVVVTWTFGDWGLGISDLHLSTSIDGGATFTTIQVEDAPDTAGPYGPAVAITPALTWPGRMTATPTTASGWPAPSWMPRRPRRPTSRQPSGGYGG